MSERTTRRAGTRAGLALIRPALRAERRSIAALALWSVVEAAPTLLSGWIIGRAVDDFLAGEVTAALVLLAVYGVAMLAAAVSTRQVMGPLARIVEAVRDRLVGTVVESALLSAVRHGTTPDAGTVARTTRQTESVRGLMAGLLMSARGVAFSVPAVVVGLFTIAPVIAALTLASLAVSCALLVLVSRVLRRRLVVSLTAEEELAENAGRLLDGLRDVAACGAPRRAAGETGRAVEAQAAASMATAWAEAGRIGVIVTGARLPLVGTLLLAPGLISSGHLTPGEVVGVATYLVTGLEPAVRTIVQNLAGLGLHLGVVLRRLAERTALPASPATASAAPPAGPAELTLHGVTFAYGPHSAPVLDNLDLRIPVGDHLAVVGPSGAGKSTFSSLLCGLLPPDAGEVRLGGRPLSGIDPRRLREAVVLVPQESYVFTGTVRENLGYLCPTEPDDGPLNEAIDLFALRAAVERLGGPDAVIDEPGALSEGERQLIVLARAYLAPAGTVVLDEATCHLDPVREARAEEAFMARPGTTLVVIAHRTSSARRAKRVLVLESGTAVVGARGALAGVSPLLDDLMR
ncbi:ABC transporter ATP-binding protein [Streptomyces marincola]|uniref:ABC transporter ATP-binding protein n=1 Tax=Streptomyces marincola TaxID=2878388 RepID=UPI001CF429A7|nr:ABC transporter ATP-binding protein [Streptomyces marincola]UCM88141.1 ABC transporter ATP-binding protein/permease [Streptomyces marincola]